MNENLGTESAKEIADANVSSGEQPSMDLSPQLVQGCTIAGPHVCATAKTRPCVHRHLLHSHTFTNAEAGRQKRGWGHCTGSDFLRIVRASVHRQQKTAAQTQEAQVRVGVAVVMNGQGTSKADDTGRT